MGIGVSIKNLINRIFGKHKTSTGEKITKEVRKRAKELGISPEEYINVTKNNGSIWGYNGNQDRYSNYDSLSSVDNSIEAMRSSLRDKYAEFGIPESGGKPATFGLLSRAMNDYQSQIEDNNNDYLRAVQQDSDTQYQAALNNVDYVEDEANRNNKTAENLFRQTSQEAENNNSAAESQLAQAEQISSNNNAAAAQNLTSVQNEANNNNLTAQREQQDTISQVQSDNKSAQAELTQTQQQVSQNNQQAQQNTANAQSNKDNTQQAVTAAETSLNKAEQSVVAAENALNSSSNPTPEMQNQARKARDERDRLKTNLDETRKQDQKAQEELQRAQESEKTEQQRGQAQIDAQTQQTERIKEQGEERIADAADNTQNVQQQGTMAVKGATDNVTTVQNRGQQSVAQKQNYVDQVQADGARQTRSAQTNVDNTAQQGRTDVRQAENEARQTRQDGLEAQSRAEEEAANHQPTHGIAQENNLTGAKRRYGHIAEANATKKVLEQNPNATVADAERQLKKDLIQIDNKNKKEAQQCFNSAPRTELEKAAAERYELERQNGKTTKVKDGSDVNLPDGDLNNNVPFQKEAANCWAHGAVTSLASTKAGENMLKSHMYRDEARGVTSVHLQEAQNNGLGNNKTGIYTFTDKEIAEGAKKYGSGDGDVTAYMLATEKYLREKGENPSARHASDYNSPQRMYEIVSGGKTRYCLDNNYINMGINLCAVEDGNMYNYETLYNGVKSGNVAGQIVVGASNRRSAHAIAIVGTSPNGNLLIQDPINKGRLNQMYTYVNNDGKKVEPFKRTNPVNGAPTYELSKEMYEKYIRSGAIYRFA